MTDVWMDGKQIEKLEIFVGEDYSFFLRGITADGKRFEMGIAKGEI